MSYCKNCGKEIERGEMCKECEESMVFNAKPIDEHMMPDNESNNDSKLVKGLVIATMIIYPLITIILATVYFLQGNVSLLFYILSLVFSLITGACVFLGGFYLIVIYLYFFSLFKIGCAKNNDLALWKRILLGICAVVSYVLAFLFIFI